MIFRKKPKGNPDIRRTWIRSVEFTTEDGRSDEWVKAQAFVTQTGAECGYEGAQMFPAHTFKYLGPTDEDRRLGEIALKYKSRTAVWILRYKPIEYEARGMYGTPIPVADVPLLSRKFDAEVPVEYPPF